MAITHGIIDSEQKLQKILGKILISDLDNAKANLKVELYDKQNSRFKKWRIARKLKKLSTKRINQLRNGAIGERKTAETLKQLDDNYHIIGGIKIRRKQYIDYNGIKNLKSAQLDLVVVGPTGIFIIEVKNWSNRYQKARRSKFSPHEQADRAAVLAELKTGHDCNRIIVSVHNNESHNDKFPRVVVCSLDNVVSHILNKQQLYNEKQVNKIVKKF